MNNFIVATILSTSSLCGLGAPQDSLLTFAQKEEILQAVAGIHFRWKRLQAVRRQFLGAESQASSEVVLQNYGLILEPLNTTVSIWSSREEWGAVMIGNVREIGSYHDPGIVIGIGNSGELYCLSGCEDDDFNRFVKDVVQVVNKEDALRVARFFLRTRFYEFRSEDIVDDVNYDEFVRRYPTVHVPDVRLLNGVFSVTMFTCANADSPHEILERHTFLISQDGSFEHIADTLLKKMWVRD